MKKIYSVMLAVMLVIASTMTVSAYVDSPTPDVFITAEDCYDADGTPIYSDDDFFITLTKKGTVQSASVSGYSSLHGTFDLTLDPSVSSAKVQLYVEGVNVGDTVIVRAYINGQWVEIKDVVVRGEGIVEFTISESGTYDVLVATGSSSAAGTESTSTSSTSTSSGTNSSATSPKTGEGAQFPAAVAIAVVCGAGAALSGRKARKAA